MATFLWIVLGLVGLLAALFVLGWANAIRATLVRNRRLDAMLRPAIEAVQQNQPGAAELVAELAAAPGARNHLYARLKELGKAELFPAAFRTLEKVAESNLVSWLMHPNELGAAPSQVELIRQLPVQEGDHRGSMFLFRFRIAPPHWAADRGWMAGVAGPYWEGDETMQSGGGTFSELTPFASMTEEQHVDFLRKALHRKGLVVPS